MEKAVMTVRDPSGIWVLLKSRLQQYLPLAPLSFKDGTGSFKVVASLQLKPVTEHSSGAASPLLSLLLFRCEDLDAFRRQRVLVDGFVGDDSVKRQSWIVVLVALGGGSSDQTFVNVPGRSLARSRPSRKAYERLESEFGTAHYQDSGGTCALIELFESGEDADRRQWEALTAKIAWCVSHTAERRSAEFEVQLRRRMQTIQQKDWDFPSFFLLKERYSHFYEQLYLLEDALRQYDELDALQAFLAQHMKPASASSLESCGQVLLSSGEKFRGLVTNGDAGDLDFYKHVFAQQCRLLFLLDRPDEVATRSLPFIRQFSIAMSESPAEFSPEDRCGWVITATTTIVRSCEAACKQLLSAKEVGKLSIEDVKSLRSRCGEIMAFTLDRVEKLGLERGFLNFSLGQVAFETPPLVDDADDEIELSDDEIESADEASAVHLPMFDYIKSAFSSRASFEQLFVMLSQMVERSFRHAGRTRFAARVLQRLAFIRFRQGRVRSALKLFEAETRSYENESWSNIRMPSMLMSARCCFLLDDMQEFAKRSMEVLALQVHSGAQQAVLQRFKQDVLSAVSSPGFPSTTLPLSSVARFLSCRALRGRRSREAYYDVDSFVGKQVEMQLQCDTVILLSLDRVVATFRSPEHKDTIVCSADDVVFENRPGIHSLSVYSSALFISGIFQLSSLKMHVGHIVFEEQFEEGPSLVVSERKSGAELVVSGVHDGMVLGRLHQLHIEIQPGCDTIRHASLRLHSHSQLGVVDSEDIAVTVSQMNDVREHTFALQKGVIELPSCDPDSVVRLTIGVSPPEDGGPNHELDVHFRYQECSAVDDPFEMVCSTSVELEFRDPLTMSSRVETFGERTFLHAFVECSTLVPVTIISYDLEVPSPYEVVLDPNDVVLQRPVIHPQHRFSFVFELRRNGKGGTSDNSEVLDDDGAPFLNELSSTGTLRLRCRPGDDGQGSVVYLGWSVVLSQEQQGHSYQVTTSAPLRAVVGQLIPLTITVKCHRRRHSQPLQLLYEMQVDPKAWMLSGRYQGGVVVPGGDGDDSDLHLRCSLLAVACGHLSLPKLKLSEKTEGTGLVVPVDADRIAFQYAATQVLVYPSSTCVSSVSHFVADADVTCGLGQ